MTMTGDNLARPYHDSIVDLERNLAETRQLYLDTYRALRIKDDEVATLREERDNDRILANACAGAEIALVEANAEISKLRAEAKRDLAENAGLIQANDLLKRQKDELHQQIAWHIENAKQQAERIRELEAGKLYYHADVRSYSAWSGIIVFAIIFAGLIFVAWSCTPWSNTACVLEKMPSEIWMMRGSNADDS